MPKKYRNTLSGLSVGQAMRRQLIKLPQKTSIGNSINALIKYKINALLATDQKGEPSGVLSKTDVMGAYYAGLPIETPLEEIMSRPPLFCEMNDSLEAALERMRAKGIYRLYVRDPDDRQITGALAYPDIVGLLYKYCHDCDYSHFRQKSTKTAEATKRFLVKEIMTNEIQAVFKDEHLSQVMEALSIYRFGALLILDRANRPCGVISKTDLALAYKHGVDAQTPAEAVMSSPVQSCGADEFLEVAIRKMVYTDVHRLFVQQSAPEKLVGVISLTDAARIRSGSCHACMSSRIKVDQP